MVDATGRDVAIFECPKLEIVQVTAFRNTSDAVAAALRDVLGAAPPEQPNTVVMRDALRMLSMGPDRLLIVQPIDGPATTSTELEAKVPSGIGAVINLSAGRCAFGVHGPRSRDVLAKQVRLDLFPAAFPVGRCAQTAFAHVSVLIYTLQEDAFEILVPRSYARHFWEALTDAALEFSVPSSARSVG